MIKHLRYFLSPFILLVGILAVLKGNYYPLAFAIIFDILVALCDSYLKQDRDFFDNPIPIILNSVRLLSCLPSSVSLVAMGLS